jgi:hypothetical protein
MIKVRIRSVVERYVKKTLEEPHPAKQSIAILEQEKAANVKYKDISFDQIIKMISHSEQYRCRILQKRGAITYKKRLVRIVFEFEWLSLTI